LLAVCGAQEWVLTLLMVPAAASAYEASRLGVVADRQMVQDMATTATTEAGHLLTADFPGYFFLHAAPGLLLVFWPQVRRRKPVPAGLLWVGSQAVIVALMLGMVWPDLKSLQATAHGHRDLILDSAVERCFVCIYCWEQRKRYACTSTPFW